MIDKEKQGKAQLIDVMLSDGSFFCQLSYPGKPFPKIVNGKVVEDYDPVDMTDFVLQKCPSLIDKSFSIHLTNQRVF